MRNPTLSCFALALLLAASLSPAYSSIIRVKLDSPTNGPGNDWDHAYHSVQTALNAAASGDDVWVAEGTYIERITLKSGVGLYGGFAGTETAREQRDWFRNLTVLDGNKAGSVVTSQSGASSSTVVDGFSIRNGSFSQGGGVYIASSSPTIRNNTIAYNEATDTARAGAGIFCFRSSPVITNNRIISNRVSSSAGYGGGIMLYDSPAIVANNLIANNAVYDGGGIFCDSSSFPPAGVPQLINNTIAYNSAKHDGGGIYCRMTSPTVTNNIIAFNDSGVYSSSTAGPVMQSNCVFGNAKYDYSGFTDPTGNNGNLAVDPKFASYPDGNYHIQPASPCVDSGLGASRYGDFDIDNQARVQPTGGALDMGADESDGTWWSTGPVGVVRVSLDGDNANDGSDWSHAKRTVQSAIDAAAAFGGEVWVRSGVYLERVSLRSYVFVYGGFAGHETARNQRDWHANATVLDGQGGGLVVSANGLVSANASIDGFTIRNGLGDSAGGGVRSYCSALAIANSIVTANRGYGIECYNGQTTITTCVVSYSSSTGIACSGAASVSGTTVVGNGGPGIACNTIESLRIANTIVAFNASGIRRWSGSPSLLNNCVYGNTSYDYSGVADPTGTLGNISVDPNIPGQQYGDYHISSTSPCVGAGDNAYASGDRDIDGQPRLQPVGGRVDIGADESAGEEPPAGPFIVVRVSPQGEDTNDGSSWELAKKTVGAAISAVATIGGEVWVQSGTYRESLMLYPCVYLYGGFLGNETLRSQRNWSANKTLLDGEGVRQIVNVSTGDRCNAVDGFVIANGSSTRGGGVYCHESSPIIANNVLTNNLAAGRDAYGGAITLYSSSATLVNNIAAHNSAGIHCAGIGRPTVVNNTLVDNTEGLYAYPLASPSIVNNLVAYNKTGLFAGAAATLRNNNVYGNTDYNYSGVAPGAGDISSDPLFVNRASDDYHLTAGSPCVDAGSDDPVGGQEFDIDCQTRVQGSAVDIGADEYWAGIADAKRLSTGTIDLSGEVATATFPGFFYIESLNRANGIRVEKADHGISRGMRVNVSGPVQTNPSGERCIAAGSAVPIGAGAVSPLALPNASLGGGTFGAQQATWGWVSQLNGAKTWGPVSGLNNIGLLVKTWGKIIEVSGNHLRLDDGSDLKIKCVLPEGVTLDPSWTFATVTGVCSCEKVGNELMPVVLVRSAEDIAGF